MEFLIGLLWLAFQGRPWKGERSSWCSGSRGQKGNVVPASTGWL